MIFCRHAVSATFRETRFSQELGGQLQLVDLGKDFSRGNERLHGSDI